MQGDDIKKIDDEIVKLSTQIENLKQNKISIVTKDVVKYISKRLDTSSDNKIVFTKSGTIKFLGNMQYVNPSLIKSSDTLVEIPKPKIHSDDTTHICELRKLQSHCPICNRYEVDNCETGNITKCSEDKGNKNTGDEWDSESLNAPVAGWGDDEIY